MPIKCKVIPVLFLLFGYVLSAKADKVLSLLGIFLRTTVSSGSQFARNCQQGVRIIFYKQNI